jgi:hypothetical protein
MHFKKPKLIYRPKPVPPQAPDPDILLTANALCLTTEDKDKFVALYQQYLDEFRPQGPTQSDLVEEMVAAKWRQRRCATIEAAILNVTMDRMAGKIDRELAVIPHSVRTALAYVEQHGQDGALARIARDDARHARTWHRALKLLRELQQQNRDRQGAATGPQNENLPNEPEPHLTPVISITRNAPNPAPEPAGPPKQNPGPAPSRRPPHPTGDLRMIETSSRLHAAHRSPTMRMFDWRAENLSVFRFSSHL